MKKIIIIASFLFMLLPFDANADVCSEAKTDADKITYNYKIIYDKHNNAYFKIDFKNVTSKVYFEDERGREVKSNSFNVEANSLSRTIEIPIYDYNLTCEDPVRIINIVLPSYNVYANSSLCKGIESYKYCNVINSGNLSNDELEEKINMFRNELKEQGYLKEINEDTNDFNYILKNVFIIINIFLLLILVIVIFYFLKLTKKIRRKL